MIRKTTNSNELFGIACKYAYSRKKNFSIEHRDVFLQGAKYIIKHLPKEWKQTFETDDNVWMCKPCRENENN